MEYKRDGIVILSIDSTYDFKYGFIVGLKALFVNDPGMHTIKFRERVRDVSLYSLFNENNLAIIPNFAWWINIDGFKLYKFDTWDFVDGFIYAMDQFHVDFRRYINGPPFDKTFTYNIEGYDIAPFRNPSTPASPQVFYTGVFESGRDFE